jgi:DNA-binding winged helix-turn-helix (wHTH) protein/TolB-like protein
MSLEIPSSFPAFFLILLMDPLQNQLFEFGEFLLVPKERQLLRHGEPVSLTGKAFDVLVVLVRNSGHLVTKDELMREVWPDIFVQETNLTVSVSALRKVLERDRKERAVIQTVPGRGYRFVAPVVEREVTRTSAMHDNPGSADPGDATNPRFVTPGTRRLGSGRQRRWGVAIATIVTVVSAAALWGVQRDVGEMAFGSVAVLPFTTDDPETMYLANGLSDAVLNGLVQLQRLRVAPRASASRFTGSDVGPRAAGRELGVAAVVTATVSQSEDNLRIQVDVVDVEHGSQVWGAQYRGNSSELVELQARIILDLPRALRVPLSDQETRTLTRRLTDSADAYRAYLQGRHEWSRRSEVALKRAIELFEEAVAIDPRFAAAHSGLADSYSILGYLSYLSPVEAFPQAKRHAIRALELDGSLAEAHASLGFVRLYYEWDWTGAEAEFRKAIALEPEHAASHQWYGIFLLAAGRPAEAFREIQLAQRHDPLSLAVNTDLGFHYYYTGQYEEAVKQLTLVLAMNADFAPAQLWLGRAYQELGRYDEALGAFRRVEDKIPDWPVSVAARGSLSGIAGRQALARQTLAELERLSGQRFVTSYGVALVHAALGQNDAAFAALEKAFDERSNWLVWLRLDPRWTSLWSDPRFSELVRRMRFPAEVK